MSYLDHKSGMWKEGSGKRFFDLGMLTPGNPRKANRAILYYMLCALFLVGGYIASFYF